MPLLLLAVLPAALAGRGPTASVADATGPVRVDGVLDEADWDRAVPLTEFTRFLPGQGGPPPGRTEVRFLQDDENLYIGVRVSEVEGEIRAHISPREDVNVDDQIGIYLDPFGEALTGTILYVNALGVQQDIRYAYGQWNMDWNTVFTTEGHVTDDGYVIEMAIPFRSLRYPKVRGPRGREVQSWGLMVTRKVPSEGTKYAWPHLVARHPRLFAQAGRLEGVRPGPAGKGVELIPTIAGRFTVDRGPAGDQDLSWTGYERWVEPLQPGLDARVGLTPDMGLAMTVNPDFSQVEGDVTEVDLNRRVAQRFPEKRAFFLDGFDSLSDANETLYTRSIAQPVAGLKLTGRSGRFGVGGLVVLDRRPLGSFLDPESTGRPSPGFAALEVEDDWAVNHVLRGRYFVLGNGYLGATLAHKRVLEDMGHRFGLPEGGTGPFDWKLAHSEDDDDEEVTGASPTNTVGQLDTSLPLGETWTLAGFGAVSNLGDDDTRGIVGSRAWGSLSRDPNLGTGGSVSGYWLGADYRNELGWVERPGRYGVEAALDQRYRVGGGSGITALSADSYQVVPELGDEHGGAVGLSQAFELLGNNVLDLAAKASHQEATVTTGPLMVRGWFLSGTWEAMPSRSVGWSLTSEGGRELIFDPGAAGTSFRATGELNLRPTVSTRLDLRYQEEWQRPEGFDVKHGQTVWGRATWQLTRSLGARTIIQYVDQAGDPENSGWWNSVVLSWVAHPGSEAYLGANWRLVPDDALLARGGTLPGLREQVVFLKYSHLFRL